MSTTLDSLVSSPWALQVLYRSSLGCERTPLVRGWACPLFLGADSSLVPSLKSHLDSDCGLSAFDLILSSLGTEESQTGVPGGSQGNGAWMCVSIPWGRRRCQTPELLAFLGSCTQRGLQLCWHCVGLSVLGTPRGSHGLCHGP